MSKDNKFVSESKPTIKDEFIKIKMNHGYNVDIRSDTEIAEERAYVAHIKRTDRKSYNEMLLNGSDYTKYPAVKDEVIEVSKTWYEANKDAEVERSIHLDNKAYKRADGGSFPFNANEAIEHGHIQDTSTMERIKIFELA